jgi:hypothetical protein
MARRDFPDAGITLGIFGVAFALILTGCGGERTSAEEFGRLEVRVAALDGRSVELREGRAELADEGIEVVLDQLLLTGTLDGVEGEVSAGFLYTNREGALSEVELVVALREEGEMHQLGSFFLGGPFRVEGIRYAGGEIITYLLDYAIDDPPCCPTIPLQRRFQIVDGEIGEVEIFDTPLDDPVDAGLESPT